jgi:hypothetical protein
MAYLQRIKYRPTMDGMKESESNFLLERFDVSAGEVYVDGHRVLWQEIDEVEVVKAARAGGLSGWLVKNVVYAEERYHVGIYYGRQEAVLPNITLEMATYVVQAVAFYATSPVRYKGPEGLSPITES